MSDTSQGEGWGQASDGKWYGPDERPETNAVPPPPSGPSPIEETATPAGPNRPWWKKKRFALPMAFVIVMFIIAALSPAEDEGGDTTAESPATTTTESQEPAEITTASTATTTAAPATTTQSAAEDLDERVLAFRLMFISETYADWTDTEIVSAADEVCRQGWNGDWDRSSDALALMDDWYFDHPFFADVYDMNVAQMAIGALTVVGGCDDLWTRIINGWG